jgi:hypothetical protein
MMAVLREGFGAGRAPGGVTGRAGDKASNEDGAATEAEAAFFRDPMPLLEIRGRERERRRNPRRHRLRRRPRLRHRYRHRRRRRLHLKSAFAIDETASNLDRVVAVRWIRD